MMTIFHGPKEPGQQPKGAHLNWMGGRSFDISDPLVRLRIAASSCFFGEPMYYHKDGDDKRPSSFRPPSALTADQIGRLRTTLNAIDPQEWRSMSPAQLMESAIDAALDKDPEGTLQVAVSLRQEDDIRTTPQVVMVRAAHHPKVRGTGLVRKYAARIMHRVDEPSVQLAYHVYRYGKDKPIPNSLKRAWADKLSSVPASILAKYRMETRGSKTVDVINLCHPKSEAVGALVKGELKLDGTTWESIISKEGSNAASWSKALDVMGHMALLRNVRNLLDKGVPPSAFVEKLVAGAKDGRQLPFRYYSAYKAVEGRAPAPVLDAIEECLFQSIDRLPRFSGRTMCLSDNSGSARGAATSTMGTTRVCDIGNLTSVLAAMQSDDGHIGIFGDGLKSFAVRKRASVFDQLKEADRVGAGIGGGTEHGIWLFWRDAIAKKERWDNVFVFSDMQAGHGGLYGTGGYRDYTWNAGGPHIDVSKLVTTYRKEVNPDVNVFLVQIAGHQDTILPEFYERTYILGGWGEGVLRFAAEMAGMFGGGR